MRSAPRLPAFLFSATISATMALWATSADARAPRCTWSRGDYFLDCREGESSEAVPLVCWIPRRTCGNSVTIYASRPECADPAPQGSALHTLLRSLCNAQGGRIPVGDLQPADAASVMSECDPIKIFPDVATYDFPGDGVVGAVKAHRHPNGRGIVADSVTFADPDSVWIGPGARVYGKASIGSGVGVLGDAEIYGDALVTEGSFVADMAKVFGRAQLRHWAEATGRAQVSGDARLECGGLVTDDAKVFGTALLEGYSWKEPGSDCDGFAMSKAPGAARAFAIVSSGTISSGQVVTK